MALIEHDVSSGAFELLLNSGDTSFADQVDHAHTRARTHTRVLTHACEQKHRNKPRCTRTAQSRGYVRHIHAKNTMQHATCTRQHTALFGFNCRSTTPTPFTGTCTCRRRGSLAPSHPAVAAPQPSPLRPARPHTRRRRVVRRGARRHASCDTCPRDTPWVWAATGSRCSAHWRARRLCRARATTTASTTSARTATASRARPHQRPACCVLPPPCACRRGACGSLALRGGTSGACHESPPHGPIRHGRALGWAHAARAGAQVPADGAHAAAPAVLLRVRVRPALCRLALVRVRHVHKEGCGSARAALPPRSGALAPPARPPPYARARVHLSALVARQRQRAHRLGSGNA